MAAPLQKKICMVGSYAVGKTSLVGRFVESKFSDRYLTNVGVKIDKRLVDVDGRQVNLVLWDLAGEDDLAQLRMSHLRGASGCILVADGCRSATFEKALELRERIRRELGPVPFVFALNKDDLAEQWEVRDSQIEPLRAQGWNLYRTSAKTGTAVEEMFLTLAKQVL